MGNKKYLFSLAILISLLIALIPLALAAEINAYDNLVLKTSEQKINLYQAPGDRDHLSDPGKACVAQHEETAGFADSLDNSVISTLEQIANVLFAICTTMSVIDTIMSTVAMAVGMWSGPCCTPAMMICPGPCGAPCTAMEGIYRSWSAVYAYVQPLCCFVNCGWCTGAEGCFDIFGLDLGSISLGAIPGMEISGPGSGTAQFGLSPYDNIYTAIGCLCPIAIIFNMRKLKTIYDVYDCCIQEACENSLNTEACERQLDEATCMYWEGSIYSILAKVLLSVLTAFLTKKLLELFGLNGLLTCVSAVFKIVQVPKVISSVTSAWGYMTRTFDEPKCKDLGFKDVKEQLREEWEYVTLIDKDNDGIYDYSAPEWTKIDDKISTTTLRLPDGKGGYVTKSFTKKDRKIIDESTGEEVSFLEWQKLKGSSVPARFNIYPDGSASIGHQAVDSFKVEDNQIKFLGEDKKPIETFAHPNELGDTKIPGTDFRWNDFERIEGNNLIAGEAGKEGYKEIAFEAFDKDLGQRNLVVNEQKDGETINRNIYWYRDDSTISITGKEIVYTSPKGDEVLVHKETDLGSALLDKNAEARKAIGAAIQAGLSESEIRSAVYEKENGKLVHIEDHEGDHKTIIDPKNNQILKQEKTGDVTKITKTNLETNEPASITFSIRENSLELPYEYAKKIDIGDIYFSSQTNNIGVQTGDNQFDVYERSDLGEGISIVTKKTNAKQTIVDEEVQFSGGDIASHIIASERTSTSVSPKVMETIAKLHTIALPGKDIPTIASIDPAYFKSLQMAYEKFGSKVTSESLGIVEGDKIYSEYALDYYPADEKYDSIKAYAPDSVMEGGTVRIKIGDTEHHIDRLGNHVTIENGKVIAYEDSNNDIKGGDIQFNSEGDFDMPNSDITSATIKTDNEILVSNKLKDGIVTSYFDKNAELKKILFFDAQKQEHILTPDQKGNLGISENLRYSIDGNLEIKKDGTWVDYNDKGLGIIEKADALKSILPDEDKAKIIEALGKGTQAEKETALKELDLDQLAKEAEDSVKSIADQAKEDKKAAAEAAEKPTKEAADAEKIAKKEAEYEAAYNMMYAATWEFLDMTLGEAVDDYIEDKCEEDYQASYPPSDAPIDKGGEAECKGIDSNIYNAQFISKTQLNTTCEYEVSYSIAACNSSINFTILLAGTPNEEIIESGSLELKQTLSRSSILDSDICTHQTICIKASDGQDQCYPPLP